jgi:hypothetical protein
MTAKKLSPGDVLELVRTESDVEKVLDTVESVCDALMRDLELPEDGASSAEGAGQLTKIASKVNHRHEYYSVIRLAVVRRSREASRMFSFMSKEKDEVMARIMTDADVVKGKNAESRKGLALKKLETTKLSEFGEEGDDAPLLVKELKAAEERAGQWSDVEKFLGVVADRLKIAKELAKQQVSLAVGDRGYDE